MKEIIAKFKVEKETKGAVRYQEEGDEENKAIRTLYIRKNVLDGEIPETLIVTINGE